MKKTNLVLGFMLIMLLAMSTNVFAQNNALDFDGSNDYVVVPADASLNMGGSSFTVEFWVKSSQNISGDVILVEYGTWQAGTYQVTTYGSNHLKVHFYEGTYSCIADNINWTDGEWHHIAGVLDTDAEYLYLYMDGTLIASETESNTPGNVTLPLYIASRGGTTFFSQHQMDEVRIWNTARTESEIRANMCKTLAGNETGLVAYYKMTDGSGTTLTDNSTNSNTGTLTNMDNSDWVTSGAALGDASTYDYSTPSSVNLASTYGDDVTVGTITGSPDGVQIYRVDSAPNVTTPPAGLDQLSQSHYFGVFVVGGSSPTYTLTYNYDGHPGISNENNLDLANRDNNADGTWADLNATLDTDANTLTKTGQTGTQYILGSASDNSLPVELTSFTADNTRAGEITLHWVTESEIENLGFLLDRRPETGEWTEIASYITDEALRGQGSVTYQTVYTYTDKTVEAGQRYDYRLADVSYAGEKVYHALYVLGVAVTEIPEEFALFPAYPNPFNPVTTISYQITEPAFVKLSIYDISGRLVEKLVSENKKSGYYSVNWNADRVGSGIYFYRINAGEFSSVKKCLVIK